MSKRATVSLVLLLLAGCATRSAGPHTVDAAPASVPPKAVPNVASDDSAFHLVAVDPERGYWLHPCAVRGREMICGGPGPLLSTKDGLEVDSLLPDIPQDRHTLIHGHWPEEVWFDTRTTAGHWEAHRWSGDHWVKEGARNDEHSYGEVVGHRNGLLAVVGLPTPDQVCSHLGWIDGTGAEVDGPTTQTTKLPRVPDRVCVHETDDALMVDGSLFVTMSREKPDGLSVARLTPDGATQVYVLARRLATARLWARSPRDVVAYGNYEDANDKPILTHFDGDGWTPMEAPPGIDMVAAYARSIDGTERAFGLRGAELSAWERAPSSPWKRLAVPVLGAHEIPHLWATDEDLWLSITSEIVSERSRLLRSRPVTHVVHFDAVPRTDAEARAGESVTDEGAAPELPRVVMRSEPVPAPARGVPAVVIPEVAELSSDPSPFHDAVLGRPDSVDMMAPPALRVCPFRGRTLICGVSRAPLISTDEGVVEDDALEDAIAEGRRPEFDARIVETGGVWPTSAWAVAQTPGSAEAYAYRFERDTWVPLAAWEEWIGRTAVWGDSVFVSTGIPLGGRPYYPLGVVRAGGRETRPVSTQMAPSRWDLAGNPITGITSTDDALFVVAHRGTKVAVEVRVRGKGPRVFDVVDVGAAASLVDATLWARSASDAAVFGYFDRGPERTPFLRLFDGGRWTTVTLPADIDRVAAYDRTSGGAERIFGYDGKLPTLFERAHGASRSDPAAWRPTLMPTWSKGDEVPHVWLANDDAWLFVYPAQSRQHPPRLMRLQPVKRVWTYPRSFPWWAHG